MVSVTMSECTEDAVANLSGRRPLTSVVVAELVTSSDLPACHSDVPLPDGAISNQQKLHITDYLDRVNQRVAQGLVSLQRQQSQWMARNRLEGRELNENSCISLASAAHPSSSLDQCSEDCRISSAIIRDIGLGTAVMRCSTGSSESSVRGDLITVPYST
jgi:hypothetical protein